MKSEIIKLVQASINDLYDLQVSADLLKGDPRFGDFSTNIALKLSPEIKKSPIEIASQLSTYIKDKKLDLFKGVIASAPGFVNFRLNDNKLINRDFLKPRTGYLNKNLVIETNNPNPFKAMHIGHALNAVVGDSLANLLEFAGGNVHRVSYHGDVGSHVGKSMWAILNFINGDLDKLKQIPEDEHNVFMSEMYANGAKAYDDDENIKKDIINLTNKSYELEDDLYKQVYLICKEWSFSHLESILIQLGSKPVERQYLESECELIGVEIVKENLNKYFFESQGAVVFRGEEFGLFTTVFISSTGRGLYAARDLGLIKLKQQDFSPDNIIIVTADEQRDYFKVIIKASQLVGLIKDGEMKNINTGVIKLSSGKMSSRQGKVIEISWLIDTVRQAFSKYSDTTDDKLVTGAIRYQLLKVKLGNDIVFDIEQSVSLQGNSGPYLMYAHARAKSILSKAGIIGVLDDQFINYDDKERELAIKLFEYDAILDAAVDDLRPHYICNYLYELCQTFNSFYEHSPVINSERKNLRLLLVDQYAQVLKHGLNLLGIYAPEKM